MKSVFKATKAINPKRIKDFGGVIDSEFPSFARWLFGIKKETPLDVSSEKKVGGF